MNLDERLEALTHSVELLASFHKDQEAHLARLDALTLRIGEGTERLIEVAVNHEGRLQDLEQK